MSHWTFVTAAYAIALLATGGLLLWSWTSMRKAVGAADELKRR